MHDLAAFSNRLRKVARLRKKWARRVETDAYRVYDADIPEMRYAVDVYGDHAVVYDRRGNQAPDDGAFDEQLVQAVAAALELDVAKLHFKRRRRQPGDASGDKPAGRGEMLRIKEGPATFLVNLEDHLDTGLFLDQRPLRAEFRTLPAGTRLLNLFCYTGSISVAAAQAGAITTNVDMSSTNIDWARENFLANGLDPATHRFLREDTIKFLARGPERGQTYDLVFLDPPTYASGALEIQRDHPMLIEQALKFVSDAGRLVFSTGHQRFVLDADFARGVAITDITARTIPEDFRNKQAHRCFEVLPS